MIRTRDSARTLKKVLDGLSASAGDEIIVVDSGSKDLTLDIARHCGASVVIATGPFNYSKSLNLGFSAAKNPWVLVLSSHAIPIVPQFIEAHRQAIKLFPQDVVVGYAPGDMNPTIQLADSSEIAKYFSRQDWGEINQICGNANTIYRRSAWQELPFDEQVRTSEDKIWMIEMAKRNYRFAVIPSAKALNQNQGSLRYMFNKGYSDRKALDTWINKWKELGNSVGQTIQPTALKPMTLWMLGGALKQHLLKKLKGEINLGNWIRYTAHILGTFFGSYTKKDNTPTE